MRVAPRRIGQEIKVKADSKIARYDTAYHKAETFTLAKVELEDGTILVAGALFNPLDGDPVKLVGRGVADVRLLKYLRYGAVPRHKDGRKADHFLVEFPREELVKGWKEQVAKLMYEGTFLSKEFPEMPADNLNAVLSFFDLQ